MPKCWICIALEPEANAKGVESFRDRSLSKSKLLTGQFTLMYSITVCTSHIKVYLGWGGCKLNTNDKSMQTLSLEPTPLPSIVGWCAEISNLWELIVLYWYPALKSSSRKSKIGVTSYETGSFCLLRHQPTHFLQVDSSFPVVELLLGLAISLEAVPKTPDKDNLPEILHAANLRVLLLIKGCYFPKGSLRRLFILRRVTGVSIDIWRRDECVMLVLSTTYLAFFLALPSVKFCL